MKQNYRKPWRWRHGFRKAGLAALLFFGAVKGVDAQINAYSFSQSSGTFTSISSTGTLVPGSEATTETTHDGSGWTVTIPFAFNFDGADYTSIYVNSNGGATFGTTSTSSSVISSSTAYNGAIAAMNRDLWGVFITGGVTTSGSNVITDVVAMPGIEIGKQLNNVNGIPSGATVTAFDEVAGTITMSAPATGSSTSAVVRYGSGKILTAVEGTAPNRTFVIEWIGYNDYSTAISGSNHLNFQVRLAESANTVAIVYGPQYNISTTSRTNQVGLRGATNTDYNNRTASISTPWDNSTAGTSNSSTVARNNTNFPAPGLTYLWTPPSCVAPGGISTGLVTMTTIPVSWGVSPSAAVSGYTIYYSTTNAAPDATTVLDATNSVTAGAAATSVDITGLTSATTYYLWIRTDCGASDVSNWVSVGSVTTACAPVAAPFLQEFSGGSLPGCWTNQNPVSSVANALWKFSGNADYGANLANNGRPAGSFAWVDASSPYDNLHNVELLTPLIDLTGLAQPYVSFDWFKNHSSTTSTTPTLPVYDNNRLTVDVNDGTGWVTIFTSDTNAQIWRTEGIALAASYVGATIQLRFTVDKNTGTNPYFYDDLLLDNVEVKEAPSCLVPTQATVVTVGAGTADFSWTAPATAPSNGYHLYYNTTGTAPDGTTVLDATNSINVPAGTTTATLPGLAANTTYYVWVRSNCGGTDVSDWVVIPSFTTPCSVFTAPWTYNVETGTATTNASIGDCWTATPTATSSAFRWDLDGSGSTPSSSTGPSAAYSGTKYFYTEASSGGTGAVAELLSPFVDVSALTEPSVQFYYHMYGSTMGELHVDVYDGAAWNNDLFVLTGQQQTAAADAWRLAIVDLGSLTITGNIQVRFRALRGTDFYGDMAIDDIAFVEAPACIAPSGLTAATTPADATITWNASSSNPSSYDVYVDTTNTQPATPTYPGVTGTSQVIPGVSGTTYYVWVVANCATATAVAGPISYTIPFPPPVNDDCGGAIALPGGVDFVSGAVVGTNVAATNSPQTVASCQSNSGMDVWYTVTIPSSGNVTLETKAVTGSSYTDSVISAYTGDCTTGLTQIPGAAGCNDDDGDGNFSLLNVTGQTPGSVLYVRVSRYNATAANSGDFQVSAYDPSFLGTSEVITDGKEVKVYPNPFTDIVNVSDIKDVKRVTVVDMAGRVVKTISDPARALQLGDLKSGMYILKLDYKDGTVKSAKVIKK
ncbi:fibronectin type III domain-containing protein [Chryseobacterium sp. MFBS3-17]|uniref:fibronectin type III domain-containing protein n=1 Tax=Chryseobacterium sp. MFBS3-17 TaxID=2886689 RepID=UPI001D0DCA58|nr:fibronectin type III domain-containing protein [Chryseobacterium sp. MFBS3-17]MCC2591481.1 fibronectin type III domain-containing protein [Chryseobacterium sp. MFBS3-17]